MKIFKFSSDCIVSCGNKRAVIIDTTRNKYYLIPLTMAALINDFEGKKESYLLKEYEGQAGIVEEYLTFLYENEFIFWCDSESEAEHFIALDTEWDFPAQISNAILEIQEIGIEAITKIISSLQKLGCQALKLIIVNKGRSSEIIEQIAKLLNESTITSIEIETIFFDTIESSLLRLMVLFPRLLKIVVFESPFNGISEIAKKELWNYSKIVFTNATLSNNGCGQIDWGYFTTNIKHFTESLAHNTCLNRKIAIDADGNIKNCPSMKESFGNIKDTTLEEAINKPGFKKYWNITKDRITKCKDCEFRHICTDCRAYLENPNDIYSAPLKCGYDPYTCKWEDWSTNPLKQQAIEYYGMQELMKK